MSEYNVSLSNGIKVPDLTSDPVLGLEAGQFYFNTTSGKYRFYNGTSWGDIDNGLATKSGVVASGSFSGTPKKATVTFGAAFSNANYSVSVIGGDSRSWVIESVVAGSFVINSGAGAALTNNTYWIAVKHGETT
jgi:hypothetical protein